MVSFGIYLIFFLILRLSQPAQLNVNERPLFCFKYGWKCPGTMQYEFGIVINGSLPFKTVKNTLTRLCEIDCMQDEECLFAQFKHDSRECQMFHNRQKFRQELKANNVVYVWKCCADSPNFCVKESGRCPGFVAVSNFRRLNHTRDPIENLTNVDLQYAVEKCLNSPLCGSLNAHTRSTHESYRYDVQLMQKWGAYGPTEDPKWDLFEWICCNNSWDHPNKTCIDTHGSKPCSGYWAVDKKSATPNNSAKFVEYFQTLDPAKCREECRLQPDCTTPWYNQTTSECLLQSKGLNRTRCATHKDYIYSTSMKSWKWICCNVTSINRVQETNADNDRHCICIKDKSMVIVAEDNCDKPNTKKQRKILNGMAFYDLYQIILIKINANTSNSWYSISDGLDKLWLLKTSENATKHCNKIECKRYSGYVIPGKCPRIIPRGEWYAEPPSERLVRFKKTPTYVILGEVYPPRCGCYNNASCADQLRQIQTLFMKGLDWFDIAYNFIIGLEGQVYEGRGWDNISAMTYNYNSISISIAILGYHDSNAPTLVALAATKQLIECGAVLGKLNRNYTLLAHRDVRRSSIPGDALYAIMHNWANYNDQGGTTNCPVVIYWPLFLLPIGVIASIFLIFLEKRKYFHSDICRHLQCTPSSRETNRLLGPIIDTIDWDDELEDYSLFGVDMIKQQKIRLGHVILFTVLSRKKPKACRCEHIIHKLVDVARFNGLDCLLQKLNEAHFLHMCFFKTGMKTIVVLSTPTNPLEKSELAIVHLESVVEIHQFIRSFRRGKCICRRYRVKSNQDHYNDLLLTPISHTTTSNMSSKQYAIRRRKYTRTYYNGNTVIYGCLQRQQSGNTLISFNNVAFTDDNA